MFANMKDFDRMRQIQAMLEKMPLLESSDHEFFFYYEKTEMLIPLRQDGIALAVESKNEIPPRLSNIAGKRYRCQLIRSHEAAGVFCELKKYGMEKWGIEKKLWFVKGNIFSLHTGKTEEAVYNGITGKKEAIAGRSANYFQVIYISDIEETRGDGNTWEFLVRLGFERVNTMDAARKNRNYQTEKRQTEKHQTEKHQTEKWQTKKWQTQEHHTEKQQDACIQELLDCDKKRCGLASYEKEMLYDKNQGHWDVYENCEKYSGYASDPSMKIKLVAKDPKKDIRKDGVIGIDFGTKSTVVVKQEGTSQITPIRIGSLSLAATVKESDYENPTIISCMDIDKFLAAYQEREGRPETSCEDLFVSYHAEEDFKNCPTENFYAYFSELKQWSNMQKQGISIQDTNKKKEYMLAKNHSIEEKKLNPIEIYAYYIGMYINNMRNGIYLKYVMSFPVKYTKETKELIRKSFEQGIKKSLPDSIVKDTELLKSFSVTYGISEPAAYAATALEQLGFEPEDETERYLYGIFDFGGGTTDFDFGVWRGASEEEYDQYNCDYILECFGADSDVYLGGENILDLLAYEVFKNNKDLAEKKRIACALPAGATAFIGGEKLINDSRSANRNLKILKESFRPLWEQHDNWNECYHAKKNHTDKEDAGEYIDLQMYDFNGEAVPGCKFAVDTAALLGLIKERIRKGVEAFFNCIEKTIDQNQSAQVASEKIYLFLAGNSSKSAFVKELFEELIQQYNKEYEKYCKKVQDRFVLIEPLKSSEIDGTYLPNAKTSVAYGLIKSRPGGNIYIKKNYATDANEETCFQYYLGTARRKKFICKLAPTIKNESGESQTSYQIWHPFQGAATGVARIYYTQDPRADVKADPISIEGIPFHEISFEKKEGQYLYIRAVKPSVIEYTVAENEESITDEVTELEIAPN